MGLLKHITIEAELCPMYARMFAEYKFTGSGSKEFSARFIFPVPEGAIITGINKMGADRRLVRAKVKPISEYGFENSGISLVRLTPRLYCFNWDLIKPNEECTVLLEMLVLLKAKGGVTELDIPLGQDGYLNNGFYAEKCRADITLRASDYKLTCYSDTHTIKSESADGETVFRIETFTGRDVLLRLDGFGRRSIGIAGGGVGFYRIFSNNGAMYDCGGRIVFAADVAYRPELVKEFILKAVQGAKNKKHIQILLGKERLFSDFVRADDDCGSELLERLSLSSGIPCNIGDLMAEALRLDLTSADIVLVTAKPNAYTERLSEYADFEQPVNLFSVGEHSADFGIYSEVCGINYCGHFYPQSMDEEKIASAVERAFAMKAEVCITAPRSAAETVRISDCIMQSDGCMEIAAAYSGAPPESFEVWINNEKTETVKIESLVNSMDIYNLEVLYAGVKINELIRLQKKLNAESCYRVKKEIEAISVKYNIVTAETFLEIESDSGMRSGVPIVFYIGGDGGASDKVSVFREKRLPRYTNEDTKKVLIAVCTRVLKDAIRCNGAIADLTCPDESEQANQTALAAAALQLTVYKDSGGEPEFAYRYLKKNPPRGIAMQLYLHRDRLLEFMDKNKKAVLKELPDYDELAEQLESRGKRVSAAAQLILRLV